VHLPDLIRANQTKEGTMATMKTLRRWTFGVGTVAALGFGSAQALAAPAQAADARGVCNAQACNRICLLITPFGGTCTPDGSCVCYI
jgi:hypothetical protein